jgi:probable rRNA maturation factor
MTVLYLNQSSSRVPRAFLCGWVQEVLKELKKRKIIKNEPAELTLVFLEADQMRALNKKYRKKNYPTDILSFVGDKIESFGELVLCPQVIRQQATEHDFTQRAEYAYMVLHGILHLLGYDHEKSPREAKKMFSLQDQIFERLSKKLPS